MVRELQVLMLEDEPADAEFAERALRKAGIVFASLRVDSRAAFIAALDEFCPDVILADYKLPAFDGLTALGIAREKAPRIPFIFVSGAMGEEFAIETLHQGAADYVLKGHLSKLVPAVNRALLDAEEHRRREEAETALKESEERFRNMAESAQDGIAIIDADGLVTYWNAAAERMFGYRQDELLGRNMHDLIVPQRFRDAYRKGWPDFRAGGQGAVIGTTFEVVGLKKEGCEFPVELSISAAPIKGQWHAIGIIRDISERKRGELALRRSNRFLRTLSRCNETLVHADDERELLQSMCRVVVEVGEFALAWVGFTEDGGMIRSVAQVGRCAGDFVSALPIDGQDAKLAAQPTIRAVHTGEIQVMQDIAAADCPAWRDRALGCGYGSAIALPLRAGGAVIGALNIYAAETGGFGAEEVGLLSELAGDLGFGIAMLRVRAAREEDAHKLEQALEDTIQAIATTIEARDPYTAGHQKRVAQLAAAIARDMGLPENRITGVLRGAEIHDIGKIYIPSEILSRPGRLSAAEFSLIKIHPQVGYDIVKEIDFPWPVAAMILQHHERLDGSGYPNGLRGGEQIILEAKILAVADVVDAMVSHRPYRAALGLDAALEEIERNRGRLYDEAVVDICLRLFRAKGFAFV
ncbi:MAG: PAS domain S-box protein [Rhodocyclaceae bacterium]|nr:PAS domain S-box protein [Rhodocyclaceae bacterium]